MPDELLTASVPDSRGQRQRSASAWSSLPTWAIWSISAAAVLSPVLAFLMAVAVEILVGALMDAGMLEVHALVAVGAKQSGGTGYADKGPR